MFKILKGLKSNLFLIYLSSLASVSFLGNQPVYADTPEEYFTKYVNCIVEFFNDEAELEACLEQARNDLFKQLDEEIEKKKKRGKEKDGLSKSLSPSQKIQDSLLLSVDSNNSVLDNFFTDITLSTGTTSLNLQSYSYAISFESTNNPTVFNAELISLNNTYSPFSLGGFSDNISQQKLKKNSPFLEGIYFADVGKIFLLFESDWLNEEGKNVATSIVSYEIKLTEDLDGNVTSAVIDSSGDKYLNKIFCTPLTLENTV